MKKTSIATLLIFICVIFAPWLWLENTYGMKNIPHYDLTMWIFMMLYGLIAVIVFGLLLVVIVRREDKYTEIQEEPTEEAVEETVETPLEELTEEEAAELQVEAPGLSEMNIDDQEPQEQKDRKASEIQPPAIWQEEEFE